MQTKNERLVSLKDKHKGERIFILGSGPSLKETDLSLLSGDLSFAMNRISLIYPTTEWRPDYYLICTENVSNHTWGKVWLKDVQASVSNPNITSFVYSKLKDRVFGGFALPPNAITIDSMTKRLEEMVLKAPNKKLEVTSDLVNQIFSDDPNERVDRSMSSIFAALQMAHYMGCDPIILLGCDLNWKTCAYGSEQDSNHFDPSYKAQIRSGKGENINMRSIHLIAQKALQDRGVEVYNASVNTVLDIYPLVSYDAIVEDKTWKGNGGVDEDSPEIRRKRQEAERFWNLI